MAKPQTQATQNRHERRLNELLKLPGNDRCADCKAKSPRWSSYSLGVLLCIRCASLHRKMGTHISKVKSLSMDTWSPEQIEDLRQSGGNNQVNNRINPHPEKHPLPLMVEDDEFQLECYIRQKWEKRAFEKTDYHPNPESQQFQQFQQQHSHNHLSISQSYETLPSLQSISSANTSVNEFAGQIIRQEEIIPSNNPFYVDTNVFQSPITNNPFYFPPPASSSKNPFVVNQTPRSNSNPFYASPSSPSFISNSLPFTSTTTSFNP